VNVYPIKSGKRADADPKRARPRYEASNDGEMRFTVNGTGSRMQITGVYERRLQLGAYTLIKALSAMADRMAESDEMGWYTAGAIDEAVEMQGRTREPPEDAESGFGGLR
jgi:hypothetical protein